MGPRHYSRGNVKALMEKEYKDLPVSMGPRHYSRGNYLCWGCLNNVHVVSMGPRHYSRGNLFTQIMLLDSVNMFQWGHDITVVETFWPMPWPSQGCPVSMGPRHYSRGNDFVFVVHPYPPLLSFNGATTLQSWKHVSGKIAYCFLYCFNGSTTLQSWKQLRFISIFTRTLKFQWGHDITVVET